MAFNIFYAWQSDTPNNVGRGLIRHALNGAKRQLEEDLEIQDAVRGEIVVDQDTQNIPGSPPIAETIFSKIRECDAFVADLTPTHIGPNERAAPNPNILIEYGYALRTLGDQRIIGVFNEAFGRPEDLPFDLQHRRWPIRYRAQREDAPQDRQEVRERLAQELVTAFRSIIGTLAVPRSDDLTGIDSATADTPTRLPASAIHNAYASMSSQRAVEQFPWNAELVTTSSGTKIEYRKAPSIFLNLRPNVAGPELDNATIQRIAWDSLRPLADYYSDGRSLARSRNGAAVYASSGTSPPVALTASILARDGSLHGIDLYHLRMNDSDQQTKSYLPIPRC